MFADGIIVVGLMELLFALMSAAIIGIRDALPVFIVITFIISIGLYLSDFKKHIPFIAPELKSIHGFFSVFIFLSLSFAILLSMYPPMNLYIEPETIDENISSPYSNSSDLSITNMGADLNGINLTITGINNNSRVNWVSLEPDFVIELKKGEIKKFKISFNIPINSSPNKYIGSIYIAARTDHKEFTESIPINLKIKK